jgi:hypothetical protein
MANDSKIQKVLHNFFNFSFLVKWISIRHDHAFCGEEDLLALQIHPDIPGVGCPIVSGYHYFEDIVVPHW